MRITNEPLSVFIYKCGNISYIAHQHTIQDLTNNVKQLISELNTKQRELADKQTELNESNGVIDSIATSVFTKVVDVNGQRISNQAIQKDIETKIDNILKENEQMKDTLVSNDSEDKKTIVELNNQLAELNTFKNDVIKNAGFTDIPDTTAIAERIITLKNNSDKFLTTEPALQKAQSELVNTQIELENINRKLQTAYSNLTQTINKSKSVADENADLKQQLQEAKNALQEAQQSSLANNTDYMKISDCEQQKKEIQQNIDKLKTELANAKEQLKHRISREECDEEKQAQIAEIERLKSQLQQAQEAKQKAEEKLRECEENKPASQLSPEDKIKFLNTVDINPLNIKWSNGTTPNDKYNFMVKTFLDGANALKSKLPNNIQTEPSYKVKNLAPDVKTLLKKLKNNFEPKTRNGVNASQSLTKDKTDTMARLYEWGSDDKNNTNVFENINFAKFFDYANQLNEHLNNNEELIVTSDDTTLHRSNATSNLSTDNIADRLRSKAKGGSTRKKRPNRKSTTFRTYQLSNS